MANEEAAKVPTVFDTTQQQMGEVYARALLGLGQTKGTVDGLLEELRGFRQALQQLPKLQSMLSAPRVPVAAKESLLRKSLQGKVSTDFLNFVLLLAKKHRFDCYSSIVTAAESLQDEMANRVRGQVTTAAPMSNQSRDALAAKLSQRLGKQVVLATQVDESIIGGVVVRVGDTVFDASIANQLQQLKTKAAKRVADAIRTSLDRFAN